MTLTAEQRSRIQTTVLSGGNAPRVDRVDFSLSVGTAVPTRVRVVEVHEALIEINPAWRGHSYFIVRDDIVIVDRSRRIVAVVPVGSSGARTGQAGPPRGGGAMVNLSVEEIRQVQIMLKEKGFLEGEADGKLGPRTRQALIAFQRQQGFQATGEIDSRTMTALGVRSQGGTAGQGGDRMPSPPGQDMGAGPQPGDGTRGQPSTTGQGGDRTQPSAGQGQPADGRPQAGQDGGQPSSSGQGDRNPQPQNNPSSGGDRAPAGQAR